MLRDLKMFRTIYKLWISVLFVFLLVTGTFTYPNDKEDGVVSNINEKESEVLMAHIRSIFEAYLNQDREAIRKKHTTDWVGFQGPSTKIERGIDDYMKNAEKSLENLQGIDYRIHDSTIQIYGDIGIVYYVASYHCRDKNDDKEKTIPLRSVDVYQRKDGNWNQIGSHISVIPESSGWGEAK